MEKYKVLINSNNNYLRASVRCDDDRAQKSLGVKTPEGWPENVPKDIQRTISRIKLNVGDHISDCKLGGKPILREDVETIILKALGRYVEKVTYKTVKQLFTSYLKGVKDGNIMARKNKREMKYSDNSIILLEQSINVSKETSLYNKPLAALTGNSLEEMRTEMAALKYSANSIETYNTQIVIIIRKTFKMDWHNLDLSKTKGEVWYAGEDVEYPIYYNNEELKRIFETKSRSRIMEKHKDVFVFGCYTCMRHSDYYLTDYAMSVVNDVITFSQKKTGKIVNIPVHPVAQMILDKYSYKIPKIDYSSLNKSVKTITRDAGFDEPTLFKRIEGGVDVQKHVPKWKLTTPHTMRRSFATNAFISGMPDRMIMKIGGWKTFKSYERYLRLSGLDIAKLIQEQPFYKDWKW